MMNEMEKREGFVSQQLQKAAENLQEAILNARKYRRGSSRRFSEPPEITFSKEDQEKNLADINDSNNNEKSPTKSCLQLDIKELSVEPKQELPHLELTHLDNQEVDHPSPQETSPPKWSQGSFASSSSSSSLASIFDGTISNQKEEEKSTQRQKDRHFSMDKSSKKPTRSFGPSRTISLSTRPITSLSTSSAPSFDVENRGDLSFMLEKVETKAKQNKECMEILNQSIASMDTFIKKELGDYCYSKISSVTLEQKDTSITTENLKAKQENWLYSLQSWKHAQEEEMTRLRQEQLATIERLEAKNLALNQQLDEKDAFLQQMVKTYTDKFDTLQDQVDNTLRVNMNYSATKSTQTTFVSSTKDIAINTQEQIVHPSIGIQTPIVNTLDIGLDPFMAFQEVDTKEFGINTEEKEEEKEKQLKTQMLTERLNLLQDRVLEQKKQIETTHQVFEYEQMKFVQSKNELTSDLKEMQHVLTKCLKVVLQREKQVKQEEQCVKSYHTTLLKQEEELNQEQLLFEKKKRQILQELMEHSAMLLLSTKQHEQHRTGNFTMNTGIHGGRSTGKMSASKPMTISQLMTTSRTPTPLTTPTPHQTTPTATTPTTPTKSVKRKSMILQVKPSRLVKLLRRLKEMDKVSTLRKSRQIVDDKQEKKHEDEHKKDDIIITEEENTYPLSTEHQNNVHDTVRTLQKEIVL